MTFWDFANTGGNAYFIWSGFIMLCICFAVVGEAVARIWWPVSVLQEPAQEDHQS